MKIVSIYSWHNASIGYAENGVLHYVLQEEKFDNIKNSTGFPYKSLRYLAKQIDITTVDRFIMVGVPIFAHLFTEEKVNYREDLEGVKISFWEKLMYHFSGKFSGIYLALQKRKFDSLNPQNFPLLKKTLEEIVGKELQKNQIEFIEHHEAHALSPIYFYGLHNSKKPTLIMTLDGMWDDWICASVRTWKDGKLETLTTTPFIHSLGFIWSNMTRAMGMKPLEHEYKVMGLAAYTTEKYFKKTYDEVFSDLIEVDGLTWKSKIPLNRAMVFLEDKLFGRRFDNIAGALQYMTEEKVLEWVQNAVKHTGISQVAFSGGVFMNVKLNKRLQEATFLEKTYFMPSCGDESNVIGAIFGSHMRTGEDLGTIKPIETMYSGIRILKSDVLTFIEEKELAKKYEITNLGDDEKSSSHVAKLLSEHEIVAVCRWAGEWGARSLCNRAILSNASSLANFHTVNDMIKMRDFWMPFAPTILESATDEYIKDWKNISSRVGDSSYYMITAVDSTPIAQKHLAAAIHQKDKTLRPQLVNEKSNLWMYNTLTQYKNLTGMSGVMNTSLNMHGYPLVWTLEQWLFTLENSGLQHILFENILISKKT